MRHQPPKQEGPTGGRRGASRCSLDGTPEGAKARIGSQDERRLPRLGSQRRIILDALRGGRFVGLDYLMHVARCGAVHSQIDALRHLYGFSIENRLERDQVTGQTLSSYRLVEREGEA